MRISCSVSGRYTLVLINDPPSLGSPLILPNILQDSPTNFITQFAKLERTLPNIATLSNDAEGFFVHLRSEIWNLPKRGKPNLKPSLPSTINQPEIPIDVI